MKDYSSISKQIDAAYNEYVNRSKEIMNGLTDDELMEFNKWYSNSKSFNRPDGEVNHTVNEIAEKLTLLLNMGIIIK